MQINKNYFTETELFKARGVGAREPRYSKRICNELYLWRLGAAASLISTIYHNIEERNSPKER